VESVATSEPDPVHTMGTRLYVLARARRQSKRPGKFPELNTTINITVRSTDAFTAYVSHSSALAVSSAHAGPATSD
jgi:hypothetical protein